MLLFFCTFILNSVLCNIELFSLCFLNTPPHSPTPLSSRLLTFFFCDENGLCLFADAQTLVNNSALMEIFNIACGSPLGAVDGLLLGPGVYLRGSQQNSKRKRLV